MSKMSKVKGKSKALTARERKELASVERFTATSSQTAIQPEDLKAIERILAIANDLWAQRMMKAARDEAAQKKVRATGREKMVAKAEAAEKALVKRLIKREERTK